MMEPHKPYDGKCYACEQSQIQTSTQGMVGKQTIHSSALLPKCKKLIAPKDTLGYR
ncbi:MAG: hypothetical protein QCH99_02920 [Candidatus Bathyarchaeota archaeon]|nr:hypothetical protein [Candidatus Bathyarchaeum tardum]